MALFDFRRASQASRLVGSGEWGAVSALVEWDNVIGRAFYRSRAFTEIGKRCQEAVGYSLDLVECHREI